MATRTLGPIDRWAIIAGWSIAVLVFVAAVSPPVWRVRETCCRRDCRDNLHNIGVALHSYREEHGSFPPAVVYSKDGKPLYSWRVLLLPFLERNDLYAKFRLDEPWDSPHNAEVSRTILGVFHCPNELIGCRHMPMAERVRYANGYPSTSYVVVTGERTMFPKRGVRTLDKVVAADATAETALVVETRNLARPWAAPDHITEADFLHDFESYETAHEGGRAILTCDGTVRFFTNGEAERMRKSLTYRGGKKIETR